MNENLINNLINSIMKLKLRKGMYHSIKLFILRSLQVHTHLEEIIQRPSKYSLRNLSNGNYSAIAQQGYRY